MDRRIRGLAAVAFVGGVALGLVPATIGGHAQVPFAVGIPTIVDPVRGVGEPGLVLDNANNAWVNGPAGSGTQTSFFWHSRDGGLTYPMLGPSQGHWICPAAGGGDALTVYDHQTGDTYLTDQEALASIGSAKVSGSNGAVTSKCATAPGLTADRPFEDVLDSTTAPQPKADGGKPILYLSWLCSGCLGLGGPAGPTVGGLAFGWSDDGVTFNPADPGVVGNTPLTNTFQEAGTINSFAFHGNTVVDPRTGYVYTPISCAGASSASSSGCPNGKTDNEVGVVIGAAQASPSGNIGQFASLTYQPAVTTDPDGQPMRQPNSLFPVLGMDSNGTLYEAYIEGDGFATPSDPLPSTAWHLYYTYSTDAPLHKTWSKPVLVDHGAQTATSDFGWMAVGDPGRLGFIWLGTDRREHPSLKDTSNPRQWHPFMAVATDGLAAQPSFQQQEVGIGPNHINDMCLQGTVGCIQNVGNRNMADFINCDIGPDGALQGTWANDANQLATDPTTLIPGLPLTETARMVSGPKLRGIGDYSDSRFSTAPTTVGISDATGDALFPVYGSAQQNQKQLDLTRSLVSWGGANLVVHVDAADLTTTTSPDSSQNNVWYLTAWQFNHHLYFARAESNGGSALTFAAGPAASFDRPGLNAQTIATLVDYSGGTTVQGKRSGNDIAITVPASVVGSPSTGAVLESVTAYAMLDNGQPLFVGPLAGNMPTIVDATPAYDALLSSASAGQSASGNNVVSTAGSTSPSPNTSALTPIAASAVAAVVVTTAAVAARRRRRRSLR